MTIEKSEFKFDEKYTYGLWKVYTEGDEEGKSRKELGYYEGLIDEIALYLADKCFMTLTFEKIDFIKGNFFPTRNSVNISIFNIDKIDGLIENISNNRPVIVSNGKYYNSLNLKTHLNIDPEKIKENALNKLTDTEKHFLGLK